ncbi:MAG: xanthine dehydrogenase family protein subunit M, partial [Betaproteobacteria bacterium]|nr:xanthine dehydrogenase family protein subunit M [Betaproteobacteria bacterium]
MKAPSFAYQKAANLEEAMQLMHQHGDGARLLAGGQSLLPALNLRLTHPQWLIDIAGLDELRGERLKGSVLEVAALSTHRELMQSDLVMRHVPLLALAVPYVAHAAIRNRGTIGGSLALADPAAEYPAVALACAASMRLKSVRGERMVAAADYFQGLYQTALASDEILCAVEFPVAQPGERFGFQELARRHGDYAMAGLAARGQWGEDGKLQALHLAFFALGDRPVLAQKAASCLIGQSIEPMTIRHAQEALDQDLTPPDDLQARAATKL